MKDNLLYISLFGDNYIGYFELFYDSLYQYNGNNNFDLLIITDNCTKENLVKQYQQYMNNNILEKCKYFIVDGIQPLLSRFFVFQWPHIYNYKKAFFIDIDVLFHNSIMPIFRSMDTIETINETTIVVKSVPHTSSFTGNFGGDYIKNVKGVYKPVNDGQFLFYITPLNQSRFNDLYRICIDNVLNITSMIDQIYFNLYIVHNNISVDYTILHNMCHLRLMFLDEYRMDDDIGDAIFTHFAGYYFDKYRFILDCFTRMQPRQPS
jgi:hypothetical protein